MDHYSPSPALNQSMLLGTGGVRWFPFGPTRRYRAVPGASALYVRGDAGYAALSLSSATTSSKTTATGFVAGMSAGWLGYQARDWSMGFEVSDHVVFFDSGEASGTISRRLRSLIFICRSSDDNVGLP
jgi:hypothetical protein